MLRVPAALVVIAGLALVPTPAFGDVICVPEVEPGCDSDEMTVPDAVNAASDDDTIRVAAGTWVTPVADIAKRLHFEGAGAGTPDTFDPSVHTRLEGFDENTGLTLLEGGSVSGM